MKRIYVVDDHPMLREGILRQVESTPGWSVCGEAASAEEAAEGIRRLQPDLVLLDISLPDRSGLELIRELQASPFSPPVLVFSMHDETLYAERVMRSGARGYLMKGAGAEKLKEAIERVLSGQRYLGEKVASLVPEGRSQRAEGAGVARLTDRELEVFELLGRGLSHTEISAKLGISARTVDAHRSNIRGKLKLPDGPAVIRQAILWVETGQKV